MFKKFRSSLMFEINYDIIGKQNIHILHMLKVKVLTTKKLFPFSNKYFYNIEI
jgi:hypothetical protein